jgi:hypothetical protein
LMVARKLVAQGYDPGITLVLRHAGSETDSLRAELGTAASLTVKETGYGPQFQPWKPISTLPVRARNAPANRRATTPALPPPHRIGDAMAEIAGAKQRRRGPGRRFQAGQSGNPAGKPRGSRNRTTLMLEELLDGEAETVVKTIVRKAKQGNLTAARLIIDRIFPARRARPIFFALPRLKTPNDAAQAMAAIAAGLASGAVTPSEAAELANVVDAFTRVFAASDFDSRLTALEQKKGTHA